MGVELEFVNQESPEQGDTYRLTFEGKIQPIFERLFLQGLFNQIEPNVFEAPVRRIKSFFGDDLDFARLFLQLTEQYQQEDCRLELVSSISKADYERLANFWLHYGIFAITQPNFSIPCRLVPYFSLKNHCSPQQSELNSQAQIQTYLKEKNIPTATRNICLSIIPDEAHSTCNREVEVSMLI